MKGFFHKIELKKVGFINEKGINCNCFCTICKELFNK